MDDRVVHGEALEGRACRFISAMPGEPEAISRERRRQEGIAIAEATWAQLAESSATLGVQMPYAS